jgi:hypothetical protein
MENVNTFFDHLVIFTAIWYYLWPFGIVCGHFPVVACLDQENSGSPEPILRS